MSSMKESRDGVPVLPTVSDAELLADAELHGEAFGQLYDRHAAFLLAWCYRRCGDAETAADITMETFAAAFVDRHRFDPSYPSARPWLIGIARHHLARLAHRRRMSTKYRAMLGIRTSASLPADELERIERLVDLSDTREAIRNALNRLPGRQAEAVWLRVGLELPYSEVAERLGCSEGAARVRVTRGLSRLSDVLEVL
jgi:RNA polymerase sigma-70 factor (ECF subfamily)